MTAAFAALLLAAGMEQAPLAGHIDVLADPAGAWTLDDVRSPRLAGQFTRSPLDSFNFGFTKTAYWYRFDVVNAAGEAGRWIVEIPTPTLDEVDFHLTRAGETQSIVTGDLRAPAPEQLDQHSFAVPLQLAAGEAATVHVRVRTFGAQLVEPAVWSSAGFESESTRDNLVYGAFFGTLLVMIFYNLLIYAWIRNRAYLNYVLYILTIGLFALHIAGYPRQYGNALSATAPFWINAALPFWASVSPMFAVLFARDFMQTRRQSPVSDRILLAVLAVLALKLLALPTLPYSVTFQSSVMIAAATTVVLLAVALHLAWRGQRAARFYLLATAAFVAGTVIKAAEAQGWLPINPLTHYAWLAGIALDVTLLSLALADDLAIARAQAAKNAERARRLKCFLPQDVAELVSSGDQGLLAPKRRQVTVCVIDLRGFTPFSETAAPEDVMAVLREFYDTMGTVVERHGGTVEHFAGDSMLIFFNAPLEIPEPQRQAVQTALEMRDAFEPLRQKWQKLGHELGLGIGIADGYATIGAIGFSGRSQYAAIGAVTNLASRLCSRAQHGEILTTARVLAAVEGRFAAEPVGDQSIRGFSKPIQVVRILRVAVVRTGATLVPAS